MPQNSLDDAQFQRLKPWVDILLITAADVETRAVLQRLRSFRETAELDYYVSDPWVYTVGCLGEYAVAHVQCAQGGGGHAGAQNAARDAIATWSPKVILMPGIAFGLKDGSGGQKLGHLLLAEKIVSVGHRKEKGGTRIPRGGHTPTDPMLLQLFNQAAFSPEWKGKVHRGMVLSQDVLVNDREYRDELKKLFPDAIGGEMEGHGVAAAVGGPRSGVAFLVVKGICDWGYDKKDEWQERAARASVQLCEQVLGNENAFRAISIDPLSDSARDDLANALKQAEGTDQRARAQQSFQIGEQPPMHGEGIERHSKSVVYYRQQVLLKAHRGEYVTLAPTNGAKRLTASKDERRAQRFEVAMPLSPTALPEKKPVCYGDRIVLKPVGEESLVSAREDKEREGFPLFVWGADPNPWEVFTVVRPPSERDTADQSAYFEHTIHLLWNERKKWVYCNYDHKDLPLCASIDFDNGPGNWESFHFSEPV